MGILPVGCVGTYCVHIYMGILPVGCVGTYCVSYLHAGGTKRNLMTIQKVEKLLYHFCCNIQCVVGYIYLL